MVSQISVSELKVLLEQQKKEALNSPIHVWYDSATATTVNNTCAKISGLTKVPNLFQTHSFSLNSNPEKVVSELASCFPRPLIVCFFNNNDPTVFEWAHETFPKFLSSIPFADLRVIDTSNLLKSDADYLIQLHVEANPTIIVAKMGHIVDKFHPNVTSNVFLSEALLERHREIMSEKRRPMIAGDDAVKLMPNYDSGRDAFEKRDRERLRIEQEKEKKAKIEEEKRVKARIAENRRKIRENN